jgi:cell volume regulation protein A
MFEIQYVIIIGILLLFSVLLSKLSVRFGIPSLILFLILGVLASHRGIVSWGIDPKVAEIIGGIGLAFILFSGGLDTEWDSVKKVAVPGIILSTFGVVITCIVISYFLAIIANISFSRALLFGAVVSSTDAAAVFNILRSQKIKLKSKLRPLLEFESGSNDPIAIFLTLALISWLNKEESSVLVFTLHFFLQMGLGLVFGWGFGRLMVILNNRLRLDFAGLYPVLSISLILLTFSISTALEGSGYLACYMAGLTVGRYRLVGKRALFQVHEGITMLVQIVMFLTLGFIVNIDTIVQIIPQGIMVALFLMFLARPISVYLCLFFFSSYNWREKMFISWVGLRGATPIILATYTVQVQGLNFNLFFNFVFFVVVLSVLLQGITLPWVAKVLKVRLPHTMLSSHPLDYVLNSSKCSQLVEVYVKKSSPVIKKQVVDINLPEGTSVALVNRAGQFLLVTGGFVLDEGDTAYAISPLEKKEEVELLFEPPIEEKEGEENNSFIEENI